MSLCGEPGRRQFPALRHGAGGSGTHRSEKVPRGQGRGTPVPIGQKWPGGQGPPGVAQVPLAEWVASAPAQSQEWVRSQSSLSPAPSQSLSGPHGGATLGSRTFSGRGAELERCSHGCLTAKAALEPRSCPMLISVGMRVVPQVGWGPAICSLLNYGLPGRDPASEPKVGERSGGQHLPHPGEMGAQDRRGLGGSRPSSGRRSGWPNAGLCGILEICSHPGQVFRFHLHLYAPYGSIIFSGMRWGT